MTECTLSLILKCLYEPADIKNFITFLNEIPHDTKIKEILPDLHQKLTKIFFDYRFYNFNKNNMYTQNIIEYFYPKNSAFATADLPICPINQIFVFKFSKKHTFTILFYKNGNLVLESSVQFKKQFKGKVFKKIAPNWDFDIFSIHVLPNGCFSVLNVNLKIVVFINCFLHENPIVELWACPLDNLKQYYRASPCLGFFKIKFYNQILSAEKLSWDKKKNLISSKHYQSDYKEENLVNRNKSYLFLVDKFLKENIDSILVNKFLKQHEYDSDCAKEHQHTKSKKIKIYNKK